ncbi:MAG: extracellular solute-binding protein [Propionibacteriaceae bacterium]|jgi:multiple sugar transport system substrate-binding protein|nr:extracellular solute-binding protein [Propionibacteriaceae bacterium]
MSTNKLTSTKRLLAGAALAFALTLSACGSGNDPNGGSTTTVTSLTMAVSSSPSGTALTELAKDFEAETGLHINIVELGYTDIATKILLAAGQSSATYDIVQFDSPMYAALASAGALASLENYVTSPAYGYDDFPEQVKDYARFDGVTHAIPLSTEPYVLWNNTELLAAHNLKPADTLDQYVANATALGAAGLYGSDSGFSPTTGAYYWLEALYLFGGSLTKPGTCESALDSAAAKRAAQFYFDMLPLTPATTVNAGGNGMTNAFIQGDVGQMVNATGYYSIVADPEQSKIPQSFEMTLPPAGPDGRHTLMFGWLAGVTANSAAPDQAWQFLEFALGQQAMPRLIELGAPPPARSSLKDLPEANTAIPSDDLLVEASAFGQHLPYTPVMSEIIVSISEVLSQAAADGSGADAFLAQAQQRAQSILSEAEVCK